MASTTGQQPLSTSPIKVVDGEQNAPTEVVLYNDDAAIALFWGYSIAVSTTTGVRLVAGKDRTIAVDAGEAVYAVAASGTPVVHYARSRAQTRRA